MIILLRTLLILAVLVALVVGFFVGYGWWHLARTSVTTTPTATSTSDAMGGDSSEVVVPASTVADRVTPEQKALAEKFGINLDQVSITSEMITCAEDALGEARMGEIEGGASPTPLEALRLLPCFK